MVQVECYEVILVFQLLSSFFRSRRRCPYCQRNNRARDLHHFKLNQMAKFDIVAGLHSTWVIWHLSWRSAVLEE